jgi:hypothetical protein
LNLHLISTGTVSLFPATSLPRKETINPDTRKQRTNTRISEYSKIKNSKKIHEKIRHSRRRTTPSTKRDPKKALKKKGKKYAK